MDNLKRHALTQIAAAALADIKPEKPTVPFKQFQAEQLKRGIIVYREPGATRAQEMQRRKERREAEQIACAPMTLARFLRTGKYIPAGQYKNTAGVVKYGVNSRGEPVRIGRG